MHGRDAGRLDSIRLVDIFIRGSTLLAVTTAAGSLPTPCRFGRFVLDPAERLLLADGQPVTLGARAFDVLVALVGEAGRLVSKRELLDRVWSGLVVEENNLQVQVSALRKLLGPAALATIPGRGYRFELPVESAAEAPAPPAAPAVVAATSVPGLLTPAIPGAAAADREGSDAAQTSQVPTNVPVRQSTLYGRTQDLEALGALLAAHPVVTITGPGGMGKTRLALAVVARLAAGGAQDYPDGVWWVELASLSDGDLVPATIARVLGVHVGQERSLVEALVAVLALQRILLVIDNCEHLTEAVAALVDRLRTSAPGVRILVTSQETLKVPEERVYRVGALALPAASASDEAKRSGAVELFAARVEAVDPHFALTPANLQQVVEICRRLDGIPLAIELAAARIPLLGVEGLRTRLDHRFAVLTAGARVVLRRHQTLRATLEWSHGLLTAEEQRVFRRLGVFAGSFTLEAAQHVAEDDGIDGWAALDHLGALVDKSLVLAEGDPVPRYRLLETTRAYALERLGEAQETSLMLRRHAEALREGLTAIARETATDSGRRSAYAHAAPELDNLRAALAWAGQADDCSELAIGLVAYSSPVWSATFHMQEGFTRGASVATQVHDGLPPSLVARFWATLASLGLYSVRRDAYDAAARSVALYRTLDEPKKLYSALLIAAVLGYRFATAEEVGHYIAEAEALLRPEWPPMQRARLEFARSRWFDLQGRYEESLAAAQRQADVCLAAGSEDGSHYAMSNVVGALNRLGRYQDALAQARTSIARLEVLGGASGAGHLWMGAMVAELLLGDLDAARASGRAAYALLLREGDEVRTLRPLARLLLRSGRPADAARLVGYADALERRAGIGRSAGHAIVREALHAELAAVLDGDEITRLAAEGAALGEADAMRLALEAT